MIYLTMQQQQLQLHYLPRKNMSIKIQIQQIAQLFRVKY